nr:ribonuclease H-like domain-containing protein [Tanacetum cinerariifolium]
MKMEHYLSHTDYPVWQVIQNGNGLVFVITDTNGMIKVLPPKTAEEVVAREKERKARITLPMALPEDHFAKFHKIADAKEMCEAIKSRFKGLHKGYDRSLPSSWSQVDLIMRTKPRLDTLNFDDLHNNLRVFERIVKGTTASLSSNIQNVAFLSADNTSNTNDINDDDLEEMDLKWQVAMISMRIKKFHKTKALKEKEDLKTKVENWQNSFKNLNILLNTQMSVNDKFGLGYGDYRYGSILSYENEVLRSVFMNKECDLENTPVNDKYAKGMHAVPSLVTGNYMPSGPDVEIDYSKFTYSPKQTLADELDSKLIEYASSVETTTSMSATVDNTLKIVYEPKVWIDAPIIKEYESDSDDDLVSNIKENIEKPSFAFTDSIKHVKSPREIVKETGTPNHYPKIEKQDRHRHTRKGWVMLSLENHAFLWYITRNKAHLADYQEFKGGSVAFGGSNERITGKRKIKAGSSMNYEPCSIENQANKSAGPKEANNSAGTQANDDQGANSKEIDLHDEHFVLPIWSTYSTTVKSSGKNIEKNTDFKTCEKPASQVEQIFQEKLEKLKRQEKETNDAARKETTHENQDAYTNNTNLLNAVSEPINAVGPSKVLNDGEPSYPDDPSMPYLEDIFASPSKGIFTNSSYDDEGVVTDFNNLETTVNVSPTPRTRIHTIHLKT